MFFSKIKKDKIIHRFIDIFECKKRLLNKEDDFEKQKAIILDMQKVASQIPHLRGWPYDREKFWDDDSCVWDVRVDDDVKKFIFSYLSKLKGRNLSLGCGCYPYVNNSVCVDISFEMLRNIKPSLRERQSNLFLSRVQADADKSLPFRDGSFDSCTMIFSANYIEDFDLLSCELKRVLRPKGKLVVVQSGLPVDSFHILLEKHDVDVVISNLREKLVNDGFKVTIVDKKVNKKTLKILVAKA